MLEKAGKNSGDNRRDNRGLVLRMVATGMPDPAGSGGENGLEQNDHLQYRG